jgi:hypothetical protein
MINAGNLCLHGRHVACLKDILEEPVFAQPPCLFQRQAAESCGMSAVAAYFRFVNFRTERYFLSNLYMELRFFWKGAILKFVSLAAECFHDRIIRL